MKRVAIKLLIGVKFFTLLCFSVMGFFSFEASTTSPCHAIASVSVFPESPDCLTCENSFYAWDQSFVRSDYFFDVEGKGVWADVFLSRVMILVDLILSPLPIEVVYANAFPWEQKSIVLIL